MNTQINLNPSGDVVTILEGEALEQKHPVRIQLLGDIDSVTSYLAKRYNGSAGKSLQFVDKELAVVVVDDMIITLHLDPQNFFGTTVTASLGFTSELQQFRINEPKEFSREELIKMIRFNRRYFEPSKHEGILKAYQMLAISTTGSLKQNSDNRGNVKEEFEKKVKSDNIPTEFILTIPVFKGQPEERFRVEICLDATDASVKFWFESVELKELIEVRKKQIFDKQLESCQDFVIIKK